MGNLNEMSEIEKQIFISKLRRVDSWKFATYLLYKQLLKSAEK